MFEVINLNHLTKWWQFLQIISYPVQILLYSMKILCNLIQLHIIHQGFPRLRNLRICFSTECLDLLNLLDILSYYLLLFSITSGGVLGANFTSNSVIHWRRVEVTSPSRIN